MLSELVSRHFLDISALPDRYLVTGKQFTILALRERQKHCIDAYKWKRVFYQSRTLMYKSDSFSWFSFQAMVMVKGETISHSCLVRLEKSGTLGSLHCRISQL